MFSLQLKLNGKAVGYHILRPGPKLSFLTQTFDIILRDVGLYSCLPLQTLYLSVEQLKNSSFTRNMKIVREIPQGRKSLIFSCDLSNKQMEIQRTICLHQQPGRPNVKQEICLKPTKKLDTSRCLTKDLSSQVFQTIRDSKHCVYFNVDISEVTGRKGFQFFLYHVLELEWPAYGSWFDLVHQEYSIH